MKNTKRFKIIEKAYFVWHPGMIDKHNPERFSAPEDVPYVMAETAQKAKAAANVCFYYEIEGEPHRYCHLRARRAYDYDLILHKDKSVVRHHVESEIERKKMIDAKIDKLRDYGKDVIYYVQSGYSGNSLILHATGHRGYTSDIDKAHKWSSNEIIGHILSGGHNDRIWPAHELHKAITRTANSEKLDYSREI